MRFVDRNRGQKCPKNGATAEVGLSGKIVSISGSKGKKITPVADWDSEPFAVARDDRSAVESLMFTIKHGFDFGRVALQAALLFGEGLASRAARTAL